ncbi:MAG: hypothetical protein JJV88_03995 [Sulfurovum sp.]|nr:hypothetical protein [Sulfurovaceae bacterium]
MKNRFKYTLSENCPNLDKILTDMEVYRLVSDDIALQSDFVPHFMQEKFKDKDWGVSLCSAQGISLMSKLSDIDMMKENMPNFTKRFKSIYVGNIKKEDGKLVATPSRKKPSHCDFYAFKECNELEIFKDKI